MEGQDSFIMREFEDAEVEFGEDGGDVIVDVGLVFEKNGVLSFHLYIYIDATNSHFYNYNYYLQCVNALTRCFFCPN